MSNVVINDRVKLAEIMKAKGFIESGDKTYKEILDPTKTSDEFILRRLEYYKNAKPRRK